MTAYLIFDCETTHLDPHRLTMLEAAWCVIGPDGSQRTSIRHRYTEFSAGDNPRTVPDRHGAFHRRWTGNNSAWCSGEALRMAEESGLYDDWSDCPNDRIIDRADELQRLILDDLAATVEAGKPNPDYDRTRIVVPEQDPQPRWLVEPERVHVGGMGVAQFDQPLMRLLLPRVVADFGRSGPTHYRPADVSVTQQVLLGSTKEHELIEWAAGQWGYPAFTALEWGLPPWCEYQPLDSTGLIGPDKPHRAALDVARGIIIQRILWRIGAPLREALGLETAAV